MELNEQIKKIITRLSRGIEITERPFASIAGEFGITEKELIEIINNLISDKKIRRFGAVLKHRSIGYNANGMCVFEVTRDSADKFAAYLSGFKQVSHCYERATAPEWPYNIYAMAHFKTRHECEIFAAEAADKFNIKNYKILFSIRELKKENMVYFK